MSCYCGLLIGDTMLSRKLLELILIKKTSVKLSLMIEKFNSQVSFYLMKNVIELSHSSRIIRLLCC